MNDRCVEYDVYLPVINAATGAEVLVRAIVHDHYISAEQVAELRLWAALPKADGGRAECPEGGSSDVAEQRP